MAKKNQRIEKIKDVIEIAVAILLITSPLMLVISLFLQNTIMTIISSVLLLIMAFSALVICDS